MRATEHPTPALLIRFAGGMASPAETRIVARHLLAGCPPCSVVLWPAFETAERLALRRARLRRCSISAASRSASWLAPET
jgi:hypothetical protein